MKAPTLSLCMIVKDEVSFLEECLRSVDGLVDEVVIGDTGSTDGTPELAGSLGARVLSVPWEDDFSGARNQTLAAATGDWILVLDADEELRSPGREALGRALSNPGIMGYNLPVTSPFGEGRSVTSLLMRLFRNRDSIRFKNLVHEQVHDAVEAAARAEGMRIETLTAEILHKGYTADIYDARAKDERNGRILEKQVRLAPNDLYSLFKYSDHLHKTETGPRWEAAVEAAHDLLHERWETLRTRVYAAEICGAHAMVLERRGQEQEALSHCRRAANDLFPTANFLYLYGRLELRGGDPRRAAELFRACLETAGEAPAVPPRNGVLGFLTHHALGVALQNLGQPDEALRSFRRALQDNARHFASVESLSELLEGNGRIRESIELVTDYLRERPEDSRAWLWGGAILTKNQLYDQAVPWLERALRSETTATEAARLVDGIQEALRRERKPRSQTS